MTTLNERMRNWVVRKTLNGFPHLFSSEKKIEHDYDVSGLALGTFSLASAISKENSELCAEPNEWYHDKEDIIIPSLG